jgi:hypothetical protein
MNAPIVRTWTDGFGVWHACVSPTVTHRSLQANKARKAISLELSAREGPGWDPRPLRVERVVRSDWAEEESGTIWREVWK